MHLFHQKFTFVLGRQSGCGNESASSPPVIPNGQENVSSVVRFLFYFVFVDFVSGDRIWTSLQYVYLSLGGHYLRIVGDIKRTTQL